MRSKYSVALAVASVVTIASIVLVGHAQAPDKTSQTIDGDGGRNEGAKAARDFIDALPDSSRADALFSFESSERTNWNFVPMKRRGITLAEMAKDQRDLVDPLLRSALSDEGVAKATRIIEHETILGALEQERSVFNWRRRDPGLYYTTVFGTPAQGAAWGWRFEGHHLSVNVTHVAGQSQVVAPLFMGANPARVPSGPRAGLRILAAEEDAARALMRMLPAERRKRAMIAQTAFTDIVTRNDPKVQGLALQGLPAAEMSADEQAQLRKLLNVYAGRMTQAAAQEQLDRIERAGFDRLHFGWAGGLAPGEPHYYRIHGPTVLIEYDNTQNDANHVHSVWRDLERDFGGDALRAHYRKHEHGEVVAHGH